ncbi:hypothetical protein HBI13_137840 [Parastagonospora nodorum]|nr:hypothetical protein HBI10_073290 [Parastagonospora nodorum]KAH4017995.1 hypothetical protein HBI13_137840 [Parastagonospora nodorum]
MPYGSSSVPCCCFFAVYMRAWMNNLLRGPYYDSVSQAIPKVHYSAASLTRAIMKVSIENGIQVGILITSSVPIMIATAAVTLRIIGKCIGFEFDWSDLCILTALVRPKTFS